MPIIKFGNVLPCATEDEIERIILSPKVEFLFNIYDGSIWLDSAIQKAYDLEFIDEVLEEASYRETGEFIFFYIDSDFKPLFNPDTKEYIGAYIDGTFFSVDDIINAEGWQLIEWIEWFTY